MVRWSGTHGDHARTGPATIALLVGAPKTKVEAETTLVWNPLNLIGIMPA